MKFRFHRLEASHCQCGASPKPFELSAAGIADTSGETESLGVHASGTFAVQSERRHTPEV